MSKIPVVFFGSGPVAAHSLELLAKDFEIVAVVTKPKPEHHKGSFPVLDVAEDLGFKIYTVSNKAELSELIAKKPFSTEVGILIDFGIIVSQDVIDYFPLGIVNSHFSVLPEWRGADPITFAILSGQDQTGVSLMLIVEKMDEGPLIGYGEQPLTPDITTPELTDKLIHLSHALLVNDVPLLIQNKSKGVPQEITKRKVSYSRKLTKEDGRIDWTASAEEIEREIRAYAEWPKSYTTLKDVELVVTKAHVVDASGKPGEYEITKKELVVFTGDKALSLDRVKPAGKPEMDVAGFLNGYKSQL